jgi:hypothetical protein
MRERGQFSPVEAAHESVAEARQLLMTRYGELVAAVLHYGAVDIDPKHLVVWVLLATPPEATPEWCFYPDPPAGAAIADELRAKLLDMQSIVRSCLEQRGWPDAAHAAVGFDSEERVAAGGGWQYFK